MDDLDLEYDRRPIGQNQFHTFFQMSVKVGCPFVEVGKAMSEACWRMGYYGGHIEGKIETKNGRDYYKVAAYKE